MQQVELTEPSIDDGPCVMRRHGRIALIWMNTPARRNVLSLDLRRHLIDQMSSAMADAEVGAIVLAGAGGCFSAGGDISSMSGIKAAEAEARMRDIGQLIRSMHGGVKPVIGAVEGWAVGAGLSIMSACDVIVAGTNTSFSMPFGKVGLMPDLGILHTLSMRIGTGRVRWLAMTGRSVNAETALAWGMIDAVDETGNVVAAAIEVAKDMLKMAPLSLSFTKQMLARFPLSCDETLAWEANAQALLFLTDDAQEGVQAFMAKRPTRFNGR